jgi:hypothetical protein
LHLSQEKKIMSKTTYALLALLGITVAGGLLLDVLPVTIHGQEIRGPLHAVFGSVGAIIAIIIVLYLAILSAPLIGCLGLIVISVLMFVSFIFFGMVLPLFVPMMVLFLVLWAYRSGARKSGRIDTINTTDKSGQGETMNRAIHPL